MSSETNSIDQMPKKSPLSFQVDLKKFEKATDCLLYTSDAADE